MATLLPTLTLYLWAVLVWQWWNRLCLSETCFKWQRRSKVPPNARCVPSYDFSTQNVNVQRKFTNKLLLFTVTLWIGKMWSGGAVNSPKEGLMFTTNKGAVGHLWSLTTFFRKLKEKFAQIDDFHLFLHLNKHLAGKKFDDVDEVQEEIMTWFRGQAANFYDSGIQKLVPRLKYLDNAGDYVEK